MAAARMASAEQDFGEVAAPREFAEEQPAPEDADEGVGVPEREGDGEANVANGEDGERVGDGPEHPREHGDGDEMRLRARSAERLARAFEERGERPARGEDAGDHEERDGEGREAGVDELGGRLRCAEPDPGAEPAERRPARAPSRSLRLYWSSRLANPRQDVLSSGIIMSSRWRRRDATMADCINAG